ncbi:hypothetical protein DPMN_184127 [Dreissena polymorpha]|uniref:Uncharacterized protein n=1 Tax=Dreissena polymorpha TaxID=45954 RepID=A0A9D4DIX9_DREPO|nr:hypothetical protein DPMN_184127 [Dreissena polymorpha]
MRFTEYLLIKLLYVLQFTRLDVGEKIYKMGLLSMAEFYIQTKKDILVYSLNQVL